MKFFENMVEAAVRRAMGEQSSNEAEVARLSIELDKLTRKVTDKEIELDRVKEKHARENREIEHKLGLHKKQVEVEREIAVKEAHMEAREGNLKMREDLFKEKADMIEEQMGKTQKILEGMNAMLVERLPSASIIAKIGSVHDD